MKFDIVTQWVIAHAGRYAPFCRACSGNKENGHAVSLIVETIRYSNWFVDDVIKYHRTIETYINGLLDAGLSIRRLLEPGPTEKSLAERPELSEHIRRPPILVVSSVKSVQPVNSAPAKSLAAD